MHYDDERRLAESLGATSRPDPRRGLGWCQYNIGDWAIWTVREGWMTAKLLAGHYTAHQLCGSLEEAIAWARKHS